MYDMPRPLSQILFNTKAWPHTFRTQTFLTETKKAQKNPYVEGHPKRSERPFFRMWKHTKESQSRMEIRPLFVNSRTFETMFI